MPVYNVEEYLRESVGSVQQQSFTDIEIIMVDDGSTDNSAGIADELAQQDQRITVYKKKGGGASSARNFGLKKASGKYIYFMDSDDIIVPGTLAAINRVIESDPLDMVAFSAQPFLQSDVEHDHSISLEESERYYSRDFLPEGKYTGKEFYNITSQHKNFVASVCLYVTRHDFAKKCNLHFTEGIMHEDELLSRQLFLAAENVYFIKEKFFKRRIRPNSVSTSKVTIHKAMSLLTVGEGILSLNKTVKNELLMTDAIQFCSLTIASLSAIQDTNSVYRAALKRFFHSPLAHVSAAGFKTKLHLRYRKIRDFQNQLKALRFRLGLRTRIKKILQMPVKQPSKPGKSL